LIRSATMATPALTKLLKAAVVAGACALFLYHLALVAATLRLGEPMGYPEVVYRGIAEVWPHQYQPGHFVDAQDNYGPGYSTFCRPFLALGLDPYVAARVANLSALLGATGILLGILRVNRVSWVTASGVASIFFALNAGSSSIQARPDFLASLLIMAVLALGRPAFLRRKGAVAAGASLGLMGLAAFLTKPYCLLAWGAAASFPFIAAKSERDPGRAAVVAGVGAGVIGIGVAAFSWANPYFLVETVLFHFVHRDPGLDVFLLQARDFCILGFGLVAGVAAPLFAGPGAASGVARPEEPERRYWAWALALGAGAMALGLGWHRGAYLTYYYHLVLPALAVVAAFAFEALPLPFTGIALIANGALLMALAPAFPGPDRDWDALSRDVAGQPGPVAVDYMLEPLVHGRSDARVAGNGINRFAIDLPDLIGGNSATIGAARQEVADFVANEWALIAKGPDPEAIYMDCYLFPGKAGDPRVPPNGYVAVPRNDHPLLLNGYDMSRYAPVRLFVIHPFYGSQNSPRQDAGKWILTIVKFARIEGARAGPGREPLPIVLVPALN
jgi:hypothetical protein